MKDSLGRLLEFLSHLSDRNIEFVIGQQQPEAVMVSFAIVGHRIEVEFFANRLEYSVFTGDEAVDSNEQALLSLIAAKSG